MEMIGKVWQSRFFSFLYIKSKTAFKPSFRTLSKLAEQLKIRVQRGLKKGLYYEINFIFIIFKKLLRHQPGTQKSGAYVTCAPHLMPAEYHNAGHFVTFFDGYAGAVI